MIDPVRPFQMEVRDAVIQAMKDLGLEAEFEIERPSSDLADFAIPCFPFAKRFRRAPTQIAEDLAASIKVTKNLERVWAERGYLNFRINERSLLQSTLDAILEERQDYGRGERKQEKVLLEHTSVNPTGPIHVGRARNPLIGDTLARVMRHGGYDVTTEYLVNDVGKQVVLLSWGIRNIPEAEVAPSERDKADFRLVGFYQKANERLKADPEVNRQVSEMLVKFEAGDKGVIQQVGETAEMMLQGIRSSLDRISVHLDNYTWESSFIIDGSAKKVVERLKATPQCREEDGAYYLDLEGFGIHGKSTRFTFTRSDGTTLYTTRDLAYHLDKFSRADRCINVLGEDQKLGQAQLAAALKIIGEEKVPECVFYSFVSLPEGRMSTRIGRVVYLDDLIDEAEDRALEEVRKRRFDIPEERMYQIAKDIGAGAIRFNIIRVQAEKQLIFQWEEALNFEGNSAPFVQYAHARACSILRKAGGYERMPDAAAFEHETEKKLIRVLGLFPGVVREASDKRKIHMLPSYGHELASAFNQFYQCVPVLRSGDRQDARLSLVEATMWALRNTLNCMGIVAPEEM